MSRERRKSGPRMSHVVTEAAGFSVQGCQFGSESNQMADHSGLDSVNVSTSWPAYLRKSRCTARRCTILALNLTNVEMEFSVYDYLYNNSVRIFVGVNCFETGSKILR